VQQIQQSAEAGAILTRQLLAFSRRQAIAEEVLDLRDVASKLMPILQRLLRDDVELTVRCCQQECPVKVDPGQIQQVVLNLVANAADAMPSGGRLHLEVSAVEVEESLVVEHPLLEPGNYALLNISDTGVGMDAETLAHIFEPFYTTKESGKGTGLGLATVYGIVKRNGGEIFVYSEPGEGTVFKVILPFTYELRQVTKPAEEAAPASSTAEETILLVEDSAALRELTRVILSRAGYKILEADDGAVALEMAQAYSGPIHLLLTDVVMPRMRGPQLAEELAKLRPGIGVVFLSGYTEEVLSESENMQGFTLVEKPYTAPILLQAIRRTLDACRQHGREKAPQQQHR
jgi:two-component system cell cycle sensor histidine kinase/response regulator CckA